MSTTPSKLDGNQTLQGAYQDSEGAFRTNTISSLINFAYNYVEVSYAVDDHTDRFTFQVYEDDAGQGTTVGVIDLVYTDSTKADLDYAYRWIEFPE